MKNSFLYSACIGIVLLLSSCFADSGSKYGKDIERGFISPPDSLHTSIYWYWISGHVSKEGVIKDLHSMKQAGINRAFIGNIGLSPQESGEGNVKLFSPEWWEITHTALKTATELGIDIGIFNSPGWSQSGGPWVKPNQAMRYLASTQTIVQGGKKIDISLERPGKDFEDVKVIAFPSVGSETDILSLKNTKISSAPSLAGINNILDKKTDTEVIFPRAQEVQINFKSDNVFTLRSVKIHPTHRPIHIRAIIQVKEEGAYKNISEFLIDRQNPALNVGFVPYAPIVISIPETKSDEFCIIFKNTGEGNGIKEIELSSVPAIERYPEKTLAKMFQSPLPYWNEYQWGKQPEAGDKSLIVNREDVKDISEYLSGDRLVWDAPDGNWIIMRTGMIPTGVTNAPASPEGTGLEADKMSKKHIEAHFNDFLGEIYRRIPEEDRKSWKLVVEDSYETGGQNFTDGFLDDFKTRYGYDPIPFLPVYEGIVVQSEDISNRFLWDVRRLVADKVAYDYVGGLREVSHKHGLKTWLENYGHWGFPGEFLQYGGQSDEIGGEFWSEGDLGNIENRAAASCGHIYGKTKISAESFTAGGGGYHRTPAMMKQRGDRFFSEGINSTLFHVYISQPYEDKEPGVNAWFGNEFNRKNTWYPHMDLFTSYIKRTNFMLQQGLNIADVAYFIGEDAPKMTGITDPPLPAGYQFDYINAEVIERDMFVKDGMLTLPHGTQYRILVLPKLETMRPELLKKIKALIEDGGIVMGPAPKYSPSYKNYPEADKEISGITSSLWSNIDSNVKYAKIGNGLLIDGATMQEALDIAGCVPDCRFNENDKALFGHRSLPCMDIYFITNQTNETIEITPEFRIKGKQPELWDATTGIIRKLPSYGTTSTGTIIPVKLHGNESAFIVFREKAGDKPGSPEIKLNFPDTHTIVALKDWTLSFDPAKRGPEKPVKTDVLFDLSTHDDFNIKHYSGTVTYNTSFSLDKQPEKDMYISFTDISAMAKVKINGKYAGGVWTLPYRINITDYVTKGENTVEVEVTTTWVNRIIGDLKLPEDQRKTWITAQPWNANSPLHKSGLIGPANIEE